MSTQSNNSMKALRRELMEARNLATAAVAQLKEAQYVIAGLERTITNRNAELADLFEQRLSQLDNLVQEVDAHFGPYPTKTRVEDND